MSFLVPKAEPQKHKVSALKTSNICITYLPRISLRAVCEDSQ